MQCNHHAEFFNLNLAVPKFTGGLKKVNFFIFIMTDTTFFFPRCAATQRGSWPPHSWLRKGTEEINKTSEINKQGQKRMSYTVNKMSNGDNE
jgi:hypothetical protein